MDSWIPFDSSQLVGWHVLVKDRIQSKIWRLVPRPCLRDAICQAPELIDISKKMSWATSEELHFHIASCISHVGKQCIKVIPRIKRYFPEAQKICRTSRCSMVRIGTATGATGSLWLRFSVSSQTQRWCKRGSGPEAVAGASQTSKSLQSQAFQGNEKRKVACQQSCICGSIMVIWDMDQREETICFPSDCGRVWQLLWFPRPNLWLRFLRCFKIRCQSPSSWIQRSHSEWWVEVPGCDTFGWFGSLCSVCSVKKCGLWPVKAMGEVRLPVWRIKKGSGNHAGESWCILMTCIRVQLRDFGHRFSSEEESWIQGSNVRPFYQEWSYFILFHQRP